MPSSESGDSLVDGFQPVINKRRRYSSGRQGDLRKRQNGCLEEGGRITSRRQSQTSMAALSFAKLKIRNHDLAARSIEQGILLEGLIAECYLNNPDIQIFQDGCTDVTRLPFLDLRGDIYTVINVMREWTPKLILHGAKQWCMDNKINERVCLQIEDYVQSRITDLKYCGEITFKDTTVADDKLFNIVVQDIGANLAIYRGHPMLGYMCLQSGKSVKMSDTSVVHLHHEYPHRVIFLTDTFSHSHPLTCMVVSNAIAKELFAEHSLGYDIKHTVRQNCIFPVTFRLGEIVIKYLETSWNEKSKTVSPSLSAALSEMYPGYPFIFEKTVKGVVVYTPEHCQKKVKEVMDTEISALQKLLQEDCVELCMPTDKSFLRSVVGKGIFYFHHIYT